MKIIAITGLLLQTSLASAATTCYVSSDGSDANPGTTAKPFKTVHKALNHAGGGDTVRITAGIYDLSGLPHTIDRPLTVVGDDRDSTVLTNGGTLSFSSSLTVKDLTFRNYATTVLKPLAVEGAKLDGVVIDNCVFEKLPSAIGTGKAPKGVITNVRITNCEFRDMEGAGVVAIAIIYGIISDVQITGNTFKDLKSTRKGCSAVVIGSNATRATTEDVLISGNVIDTVLGPTWVKDGAGPEVHGILACGTNLRIVKNTVRDLGAGTDHEAIYMKARDSIIADNVVENCGSGSGGADISSKGGELSEGNVISGNRITGDRPGRGMLINGGTVVKDNHITKTNGFNGIDVYAFGKPVTIAGNYVETKSGASIRLDGGKDAVISDNVAVCYEGVTIKVCNSTGTRTERNQERRGRD